VYEVFSRLNQLTKCTASPSDPEHTGTVHHISVCHAGCMLRRGLTYAFRRKISVDFSLYQRDRVQRLT
jgi:hypothetical protein